MEWISVEDRLPPEMTYELWRLHYDHGGALVLFMNDLQQVDVGFLYNGIWQDGDNECWCDDITHWMPLPEPPK